MWMFIFAKLTVFALLLAAYAAAQRELDRGAALGETVLLTTNGYCVAGRAAPSPAPHRLPARWLVELALLSTLCEGQLVIDHFMSLRRARAGWRLLPGAWLLMLGRLIGLPLLGN